MGSELSTLASTLIAASAAIILALGLSHFVYTLHGSKLHPRDPELAGLLLLVGYVILGKLYWFSIPFRGSLLAALLYVTGLVVSRAESFSPKVSGAVVVRSRHFMQQRKHHVVKKP